MRWATLLCSEQAHACEVSWAWIWSLWNCVFQTAFLPSELLPLGILIVWKAECRWFACPPRSDTVPLPLSSRLPSESCSVSWSTGESCMFQITVRSLSPSMVSSSSRSKSVKIDKVQFKFGGSDHVCGFHSVQDPFFLVASFVDSALASDARPTISKAYWIGCFILSNTSLIRVCTNVHAYTHDQLPLLLWTELNWNRIFPLFW